MNVVVFNCKIFIKQWSSSQIKTIRGISYCVIMNKVVFSAFVIVWAIYCNSVFKYWDIISKDLYVVRSILVVRACKKYSIIKNFFKNWPLVTLYIVSKNHEKYIAKCIKSALCQTYNNLELYIIDDNSLDKTSSIISKTINISEIQEYRKKIPSMTKF